MEINGTLKSTLRKLPFAPQVLRALKDYGAMRAFKKDFRRFKELSSRKQAQLTVDWKDRYPCLMEKTVKTAFEPHYTYHPAWAARILKKTMPEYHVDISSVLNFSCIVSAFIPVRSYHYDPVHIRLPGLTLEQADLLDLPFDTNSVPSLSCMHVVEHIGLGRYGDPLDPDGDCKAVSELKRVLAPGGDLLFVVPVGRPRIQFNAHRIYSYEQIMEYFDDLAICQFALVPDEDSGTGIIEDATAEMANKQTYGCGCFWFKK
jgi:Caenorhabditis protein of unknown function, DUF268.